MRLKVILPGTRDVNGGAIMARRTEPVSFSVGEAELSYAASCLTGLLVLVFAFVAL